MLGCCHTHSAAAGGASELNRVGLGL
jgi:hypothetical protein